MVRVFTVILTILTFGSVLPPSPTATADQARLRVVATFSIVGDLVKNIGGGAIALETLVGTDGDAHTYEPLPRDARVLLVAEVIFESGFGFEPWLDRVYRSSRSTAPRIQVGQGVAPRRNELGEPDPHFWHDVSASIIAAQTIRDALVGIDPLNAEGYTARADAYIHRLEALDVWVFEQVASLPVDRRTMVTSHDTFEYFAARYDLRILGFVLPFSTEGQPSAREVAGLVQDIRAARVPAVFTENVSDPRLLQRIAREAGVALAQPLYTDALGPVNSPASTYIDLVRYNVQTIVSALSR